MEGASAEGDGVWQPSALVAAGEAAEEVAAPAVEAPAAPAGRPAGANAGTRPQDVTERSTPRFLRSLHQALFGPGARDAATQPDADDQAFMEQLSDAIGKTETELHRRQGAVLKAPDRTAERYWSQFWLAVLHDEEPLTPTVVAMRRTAKERMAFETSKYVNPAVGGNKLDLFYAVSAALSHASGVLFTPEELNQACASFSNKERAAGGAAGDDEAAPASAGSKTGVKSVNRAQLQELLARKKLGLEDFKRKVFKDRLTPEVLAKVKAGLAELAELEKKSAADAGSSKRKPKGGGGGGDDDDEGGAGGDGAPGGDGAGPGAGAARGKRSKRGQRGGGGGGAEAADAGVAAGDVDGAVMSIDAPLPLLPLLLAAPPPAEVLRPVAQRSVPLMGCAPLGLPLHAATATAAAR